ncbi:MAG: hypothetical protein AAFR58_11200 [Cyanobacteria bacterium J06627_28]
MRDHTMRRLLLVALATTPLTGCQYLSAGEDIEIIDPFEAVQEVGEDIATQAGEEISEALADDDAAFGDPTVEAVPVVTADLIPSTDPGARTQLVNQSRTDPFASLPIPITPEVVVIPEAAGDAASARGGGGTAASAEPSRPEPTAPPVRVQPPNEPLVRPSPIATLPTIPQPVIAPTVSVSGIIQLGGEPYAIVSAGSEPERYVRVGDRIANGSVRVKRIDTLAFEPQVIFEENGIEVSRPVNSSGGQETAAEDSPVATLPTPQIPVPNGGGNALPAISLPTPPIAPVLSPADSGIPGSLLLLPPEVSSQAILPNMQVALPDNA